MTTLLEALSAVMALTITAAALGAGLLVLIVTRRPATALSVFLDLLLAAGLLRLTGDPGWPALAAAATVVALRRLIGLGLRRGGSALRGSDRAWTADSLRSLAVDRLVRPAWRL